MMMTKGVVCGLFIGLVMGLIAVPASAQDAGSPLGVRIMSYGKYEEVAWTHLPSIGVHYIFLKVPAPDQVDAVMKRLKEHGLTPPVLRGETDLAKESSADELGAQAAVCEKMGVKYMFLSAKRNGAEKAVVYERLRRAGELAKRHNVTISLETHPDLCTNGDVQLETMKAIDHPNVRVNFDTANITYYNQSADALAELKKIIEYVATVELKDHSGEPEAWDFPVLGKGKTNFPGIVQLLKERKFAGPVTIEFEGTKGVDLTEDQTKQAIADSVAYVRTLGQFK